MHAIAEPLADWSVPSHYDTLISEIYLAGAGMRSWSVPLRTLAELTGSRNALLQSVSLRTTPAALIYRYDDGDLDHGPIAGYAEFMEEYGDPRVEHSIKLYREGYRFNTFRDHDFTEERQMRRDPYYADVLSAVGLKYAMIANPLHVTDQVGTGVSLQRTPQQGPGDDHAKCVLQGVSFHFVQALRMQDLLKRESLETTGQFRPFQLPRHASMLKLDGTLLASSPDLDGRLLAPGTMRLRGNRLEASSARRNDRMKRSLQCAARGALSQIELPNRRLRLRFVPIVGERGLFLPAELMALMIEPMSVPATDPSAVARKRYGLTPSEAEIVNLLSTGDSLRAISERRCVSIWTVRTQLKAIFHKMGLRSQREVVAWARRVAVPEPHSRH